MSPRLPAAVTAWLEGEVGAADVVGAVGGGCINPAVRVRWAGGEGFLKFGSEVPAGFFGVEADGLRALASAADGVRVPAVLGVLEPAAGAGPACLLLEWLEPGRPGAGYWEQLGRGLAGLHRPRGSGWGWERDGFIGSLPQANAPVKSWPDFWAERRLEPQLRLARDAGWQVGRPEEWDTLWRGLPELLAPAEAEGASLLHGDLWNGNVLPAVAADGAAAAPALVDPAAYRGHREVDLAMAELFGGFDPRFFAAYREAWPPAPGDAAARRAAYQLFYLLVHVNLFGAGYVSRAERALRGALG